MKKKKLQIEIMKTKFASKSELSIAAGPCSDCPCIGPDDPAPCSYPEPDPSPDPNPCFGPDDGCPCPCY